MANVIQRFFANALPERLADDMQAESEAWQIRCCTCGSSRSVADAGGIRWKARSAGKRTLLWCPHCHWLRIAAIEKVPQQV